MSKLLSKISSSLARDRALPLGERVAKGARYVVGTTLAPIRLRDCDTVGPRARAIGRPRVRNEGRITIGCDFVCNSSFAPVDLATAAGGEIAIGDGVALNFGVSIFAAARVDVGRGASVGPYCVISDTEGAEEGDGQARPVTIGEGVWLAGRVTVQSGVTIGAGSVITAGSVVAQDIPPGVVAGGIPARVLRRLHGAVESETEVAATSADIVHADGESYVAEAPARAAAPVAAAPAQAVAVPTYRGVLLTDFTVGDLPVRLRDASDAPVLDVAEAPYGQVTQYLLQPAPEGAADFAVVWTRPEQAVPAFQHALRHEPVGDDALRADVDAFCALVQRAAASYRVVIVPTWTLPAHHRGLGMIDLRPGGARHALAVMNQRLGEQLAGTSNAFVLDASRWQAAGGRSAVAERAWYLGKVAFHGEVLAEAARDIKAVVRGVFGQARKLLVLDLDDTLWGGIVGDQGWENLRLGGHDPVGEAFVDFQVAIKQLTRRGIVLALCSKNTESVALEAIASHPEMVLKQGDFVGWRINWSDKARNIADLAAELNLGLQSVVFIDDNPVERARVREALPEVLVPEWPEDKLLYPSAFRALTCFDVPVLSREDAERTALYAAERQRDVLRESVGSVEDWLASLDITVRAEPLDGANVVRTTQLLNKTNQMNLSTRRLTEAELTTWAAGTDRALWAVHVSDRFGDAGLTGILSVEAAPGDTVRVVDFVLSCRVMGRKVEDAMTHLAVEWARARGAAHVEAPFRPTSKNKPCHDYWKGSGFESDADGLRFTWDAATPFALPTCITLERA